MVSKLIEKIQKTKAPICVGLDPMLGYIPEHVRKKHLRSSERPWKERQRRSGSLTVRSWMRRLI